MRVTVLVLAFWSAGGVALAQQSSNVVQPENWWDILPRPGYASLTKVGLYGAWFEVYQLPHHTFAIYEPYQFQEAISYLVLGSERAALIDSGNGIGNIRDVVDELTDLPVTVLLTHEHSDHFGGAHGFDQVALFNDPRALERVRAGVANDRARRSVTGEQVWRPLPEGVDPATFSIPGIEPKTLLEDGQIIDLGGRTLEVIHSPGHSPGSVCYLDRENRLLFTGDHFYPGPLYAFGATVNIDDYIDSNDDLAGRIGEYDYVLSGHNEPWIEAAVIPRVSEAFRTILNGEGEYSEDSERRRYRFDGFDIIVRTELVEK